MHCTSVGVCCTQADIRSMPVDCSVWSRTVVSVLAGGDADKALLGETEAVSQLDAARRAAMQTVNSQAGPANPAQQLRQMLGAANALAAREAASLQQGDALTFGAAVPHSWRVVGDGARILWILAPALPDPQRSVR